MENRKLQEDLAMSHGSLATSLATLNTEKDELFLEGERAKRKLEHVENVRESMVAEIERIRRENSAARDSWKAAHDELERRNEELYLHPFHFFLFLFFL